MPRKYFFISFQSCLYIRKVNVNSEILYLHTYSSMTHTINMLNQAILLIKLYI